jgi:hypothetical protein
VNHDIDAGTVHDATEIAFVNVKAFLAMASIVGVVLRS